MNEEHQLHRLADDGCPHVDGPDDLTVSKRQSENTTSPMEEDWDEPAGRCDWCSQPTFGHDLLCERCRHDAGLQAFSGEGL
jgi:hypothetical protein